MYNFPLKMKNEEKWNNSELVIISGSILLYTVAEPTSETETIVEDDLRICQYCLTLLESRELMKASRDCKPLISELYDKLRSFVLEVDNDIELFEKMSLSLK